MCKSCQAFRVNGILCHETGCPDEWQDYSRECKWCGSTFKPESKHQEFCEDSCYCAYNGLACEEAFNENCN